jgi:hypothetical protein
LRTLIWFTQLLEYVVAKHVWDFPFSIANILVRSRNEGGTRIMIDWLFMFLRSAQEFFTYMETSSMPAKGSEYRPMIGAQGLWARRDLCRATPAVTRGLGFSGLIQRTTSFSRLLRLMRLCGGCILTQIPTWHHGNEVSKFSTCPHSQITATRLGL